MDNNLTLVQKEGTMFRPLRISPYMGICSNNTPCKMPLKYFIWQKSATISNMPILPLRIMEDATCFFCAASIPATYFIS